MLPHLPRERVVVVMQCAADQVSKEASWIAMRSQLAGDLASIAAPETGIVDAQHEPRV